MKLILIRHGLTEYNLAKRYCGLSNIGLSAIGKQNAQHLRNKLSRVRIDKVFCSDLKRCRQTARIIFSGSSLKIVTNPNLREINFGEWEGLTFEQVHNKSPSIYKKWLKNPFLVDIPGGENINNFISRVKKELENIRANCPDKTVALVTHLGVIRAIFNTLLFIKKDDFWHLHLKPETAYIITYSHTFKPKITEL